MDKTAEIAALPNVMGYLVKLADWAAGEGFCQIEGIADPDQWLTEMWATIGVLGEEYTPEALIAAILQEQSNAD